METSWKEGSRNFPTFPNGKTEAALFEPFASDNKNLIEFYSASSWKVVKEKQQTKGYCISIRRKNATSASAQGVDYTDSIPHSCPLQRKLRKNKRQGKTDFQKKSLKKARNLNQKQTAPKPRTRSKSKNGSTASSGRLPNDLDLLFIMLRNLCKKLYVH